MKHDLRKLFERPFGWLARRRAPHRARRDEQSISCDTNLEERAADLDFGLRRAGQLAQDQINRMARDLFLDGASTASTHAAQPGPALPEDWAERMKLMIEELKPKARDALARIIVTTETTPGTMLKCRYHDKWHALIHPDDWERVKKSIATRPAESGLSPLYGIPVIVNDDLAREILIGAILETAELKRKRQQNARWS